MKFNTVLFVNATIGFSENLFLVFVLFPVRKKWRRRKVFKRKISRPPNERNLPKRFSNRNDNATLKSWKVGFAVQG